MPKGRGKARPKGRGKGGQGGKGRGKGSAVNSIYQHATAFMPPLQQDLLMCLVQDDVIVVPGSADKIETVFQALSIEFRSVQQHELARQELKPNQTVFVNCCANCGQEAATTLGDHMRAGGVVVTTDHEAQHLLEKVFPDVVRHCQLSGGHDACLTEVNLTHCASCCFPHNANWFIDGGAHGVKVLDPSKCRVLVKSPDVTEQNVVLELPCGKGRAIHLISHFEQVSRHMGKFTAATPIEISALADSTGVKLSDDELKKIAESGVGIRQLQTAVAGIGMLVNLLLLGKLGARFADTFSEQRMAKSKDAAPSHRLGDLQTSPQTLLYTLAQSPVTLHSDVSADGRVQEMRKLVAACAGAGDALFPLKLAAYLRRDGGHRETALCLLALVMLDTPSGDSSVALPSQAILKEPSALARVPEWMEALAGGGGSKLKWSNCLKKTLRIAFTRLVSLEGLARVDRSTQAKLKKVVRCCHADEPHDAIMALMGKRCPSNEEEWSMAFGPDYPIDPEKFDVRFKVARDTAAVKLSAVGKAADETKERAWEELLLEGNLTAKELARNLRNMLSLQLSDSARATLLEQLQSRRFAGGLTLQQLYVAWREVENDTKVKDCLRESVAMKTPEKGVTAKRLVVIVDVSPSMSRPCGAGTSSTSCKEVGVLFADILRRGWGVGAKDKGWFRLCTFPQSGKGADVDEVDAGSDKHCFDLAVDIGGRSVMPSDEICCVPWDFLRGNACGESDLVVVLTDHDPTVLPAWSSLPDLHHAAARTWWKIRCVNLRGAGDSPVGSQIVNGCDEAAVRRVIRDQDTVVRNIRNLVFERLPREAAATTVVMLKTQHPKLGRNVLKIILSFAAPLSLLEKKLGSQ